MQKKLHTAARLARLLDLERRREAEWSEQDLRGMLQHQLEVPVAAEVEEAVDLAGDADPTFRELLCGEEPPLQILEATRRFAKACRRDRHSVLPPQIPTLLYFASIAAARLRWGVRLTRLDDRELGEGVSWALAQSWLDEQMRALFRQTLLCLDGARTPSAERRQSRE